MANIKLKHVYKVFDDGVKGVTDFNLEIKDKEFLILVGPSGCGKSTTLRMIAGIEKITDGELYFDEKLMNDVPSCDRDIAMVFQNYALYPHMSVYDNIAYSLKIRKVSKEEIHKNVMQAAQMLGLTEVLNRKPKELSGGQKQRVAMGRAIVRKSKVFLMDEPLSNLDAKLRNQMRSEILKLYQQLDTTFIYVTHDQTEAMTLGTKIVVMKDGEMQQVATPHELYYKPANVFVAGFIGTPCMNMFEARCVPSQGKLYLEIDHVKMLLSDYQTDILRKKGYTNEPILVGVRPEDLQIVSEDIGITRTVSVYEMLGAEALLHCDFDGKDIAIRTHADTSYRRGDTITFAFDMNRIHLFDYYKEYRIVD